MSLRIACTLFALAALATGASLAPLGAQNHILSADSGSAIPGGAVSIPVFLENDEPVRGFSLGLAHLSILSLGSIAQGDALLASNGGTGPDFFFQNIAPANGPGGTCGAVLSFAAPLDDIPVGSGNELVLYNYTAAPTAIPGAVSPLDLVDTLGSPPLETIVSVAGVTRIPSTVSGSVSIVTAPVTGLSCVLTDLCSCEFTVSWTNNGVYDAIVIRDDGVVVQTLAGNATSTIVHRISTTTGGPDTSTLQVIARRNLVDSAPASCIAVCPDVPPPVSPAGLACVVDPFTGIATLTWTNPQVYSALAVSVDGAPEGNLPGSAATTTVSLPTPGVYTLCLSGGDICSVPFTTVCCTAVYVQVFVRGDANADGGFNISDPISGLNYLFGGGTIPCLKALDANDNGETNIADIIAALQGIFGVGALPPAPFPGCGVDPTPDVLTCASFATCP